MIKSKLQQIALSLGYVVVPRWGLSQPSGIELFDSLGYHIIPKASAWSHYSTLNLKKLFRLLQVDCVLDVGANVGQYWRHLRNEVGFDGVVVSFEPIPDNVRKLRDLARADDKWIIEECALGSTSCQMQLNVMNRTDFSSFLEPDHRGGQFEAENRIAHRVSVPVRTLDEIFPKIAREAQCKSVYLKVDTQGYDLEVIKGGQRTLKSIVALQTEASVIPIYEGMPDYVTTVRTLEGLGFVLSGIYPNHDGNFPKLIEFDAVMIKRDALGTHQFDSVDRIER